MNNNDIALTPSGDLVRIVQPGSVVTGVAPIEREGVDTTSLVFWPTVSLTVTA